MANKKKQMTKRQLVLANMAATIYAGQIHAPEDLSSIDAPTLVTRANELLEEVEKR